MRMVLKQISFIIIFAGVLVLTGCTTNCIDGDCSTNPERRPVDDPSAQYPYSANIGSQVEVRKNVQFGDIPAPQEFTLDKQKTKTFQGSTMRFGTLVYAGIWNVWETNQWYLNAMDEAGWKLINSKFENDYLVKNYFKKQSEMAAIEIADNNDGLTIVTILLNDDEQEIQLKEKLANQGKLMN